MVPTYRRLRDVSKRVPVPMIETLQDMPWALEVSLYKPLGNDKNLPKGELLEQCSVGSLTTRADIGVREGRAGPENGWDQSVGRGAIALAFPHSGRP
jgi:hypothetical protein